MNRRFALFPLLLLTACSADESSPSDSDSGAAGEADASAATGDLTYYGDTKAVIDARCANCHQPGDIGPFPLTTYEEVMAFEGPVRASIESGSMPPWQPSDDCNTYAEDFDLTEDETALLLAWLDEGAAAGDPADAPAPIENGAEFRATHTLLLPEPYTPTREPDDYRCQLIPWPDEETSYVTGVNVTPDRRAIVHHVVLFTIGPDQVEQFMAYDEAEEGPGYTCYGGPTARGGEDGGLSAIDPAELFAALQEAGLTMADLQSGNFTGEQFAVVAETLGISANGFSAIGSWVPGAPMTPFPEGTGIRMEPGSMIVAQMHYNTLSSAPVPDQSMIEISTASSVEREAVMMLASDVGWLSEGMMGAPMEIPAGEPEVSHSTVLTTDSPFVAMARQNLGVDAGTPLLLHTANHHMHELGTRQRSEIVRADGSTSCLLDVPDWDFSWQGSYTLNEPIRFGEGDELWMGCTWDNSEANQPIIDGAVREPADVEWGEDTTDEMCLAAFYVTVAE